MKQDRERRDELPPIELKEISPSNFGFRTTGSTRFRDGYASEKTARLAAIATLAHRSRRTRRAENMHRSEQVVGLGPKVIELFPGHKFEMHPGFRPKSAASLDGWREAIYVSQDIARLVSWNGVVQYAIHDGHNVAFLRREHIEGVFSAILKDIQQVDRET